MGGVQISFDSGELKMIFGILNEEFQVSMSRQKVEKLLYNIVDAVENICKRSNLGKAILMRLPN